MPMDSILATAVEPARRALEEATDAAHVGEHLGTREDGDYLVVQLFASHLPGYRGWFWAVSLSRSPQSDRVTVNEVVLLPGTDSISAPEWTPYKDRVEPGDMQPGDVLPPETDDPRLAPAWLSGDPDSNPADIATAREHALGRSEVLSQHGRLEAADRWYAGTQGPYTAMAEQAPASCHTCGFLVRLAGPLSATFGVCSNGRANDDGQVVALSHGCGAHSSVAATRSDKSQTLPDPVLDTVGVEVVS